MGTAAKTGHMLRATLCEVERGVFYATYPDCDPASDADELAAYQVGTSAADAKQKIERRAHALGYDFVSWTEMIIVPSFADRVTTPVYEPMAKSLARPKA